MHEWLTLALRPDVVRRGIRVGLVVGTLLTIINYGDIILSGRFDPAQWWRIALTYCVPYLVSTYAGVSALKDS